MVNVYDVDAGKFILSLKEELKKCENITVPEWSKFVKTGIHKESVPVQNDFWYIRGSSILRKLYINGAKGVSKLRTAYGGRQDRGVRQEITVKGAGKIIRVLLQQMEKEGLVVKVMKGGRKGRQLTPKAIKLMDNTAYKLYASELK